MIRQNYIENLNQCKKNSATCLKYNALRPLSPFTIYLTRSALTWNDALTRSVFHACYISFDHTFKNLIIIINIFFQTFQKCIGGGTFYHLHAMRLQFPLHEMRLQFPLQHAYNALRVRLHEVRKRISCKYISCALYLFWPYM